MEAGRELDAEVAIKVMSWKFLLSVDLVRQLFPPGTDPLGWDWMTYVVMSPDYYGLPSYSTDIDAAWLVVDAFDEVDLHKGPHGWLCRLERGADDAVEHGEAIRADTAPLAISKAALAAVGVEAG